MLLCLHTETVGVHKLLRVFLPLRWTALLNCAVVKTLIIGLSRVLIGNTTVTVPANIVLLIDTPVICNKPTIPNTNQQLVFVRIKHTMRVVTERSLLNFPSENCLVVLHIAHSPHYP